MNIQKHVVLAERPAALCRGKSLTESFSTQFGHRAETLRSGDERKSLVTRDGIGSSPGARHWHGRVQLCHEPLEHRLHTTGTILRGYRSTKIRAPWLSI